MEQVEIKRKREQVEIVRKREKVRPKESRKGLEKQAEIGRREREWEKRGIKRR